MFVTLTDKSGDRITFNVNKILLICEKRKKDSLSSVVVTDDGTPFDVKESFDAIASTLSNKG